MSRNTALVLLFGFMILLGAAFYFWKDKEDKSKFDWRDSWSKKAYSEASDQPYGTQVLHRLLEDLYPGEQLIDIKKDLAEELLIDHTGHSNYFFIGEGMYLDSLATAHLLNFVEAGNTAFLASKTIPFDLMSGHIYYNECEEAEWSDYQQFDDSLAVKFSLRNDPATYTCFYAFRNQPKDYAWSGIESRFFCDSLPHRALGFANDSMVNFAEYPYGKGRFILLTTPIVLSNFHLLRKEARPYAGALLAHLQPGDIYWDTYSRVPEEVARRQNNNWPNRDQEDEHLLTWLLQQPPLAWAWYLLVGLAATYLIFRAKRRQRIIPILPKNENSSYEFITTIANLHFRERDYRNVCIQGMRLFLAQVRERYGLLAQLESQTQLARIDNDFIAKLAAVSQVPEKRVRDVFSHYSAALQGEPTEEMMTDLYLMMELFWQQAK